MKKRVGIYPGTFDPLHVGHISFAQTALQTLSLDRVLFIPERVHLRKSGVSDFYARMNAAKKQLEATPELEVIEIMSVPQTMDAVSKELPELFSKNDIVMLIGSDTLRGLSGWVGIAGFLSDVELVIGLRGTDTAEALAYCITDLETLTNSPIRHTFITTPHSDVSSTEIRHHPDYTPL